LPDPLCGLQLRKMKLVWENPQNSPRVFNLFDNAVKYSEKRKTSSVELLTQHDTLLLVKTTAFGIPPRELKRIFRRFYRGKLHDRSGKGNRAGLFIVRSWSGRTVAMPMGECRRRPWQHLCPVFRGLSD